MKLIKKFGFLVLVLVASGLHAQPGQLRLGLLVTPGVSWISTDKLSVSNVNANATVGLGAHAELGITEHFFVESGLGLSFSRGGTLRHQVGGNFFPESRLSDDAYNTGLKPLPDGTKLKYNLQYLNFPIALKWRSRDHGPFRYYAEAPEILWSFTVQRRGSINAGDIQTSREDISKDVNAFNVSLGLGAGLEYVLQSGTVLICGLHYQRGLVDITGNTATTAVPNPDNNPFDPNDDFILKAEDSKAVLNGLGLRLGVLF